MKYLAVCHDYYKPPSCHWVHNALPKPCFLHVFPPVLYHSYRTTKFLLVLILRMDINRPREVLGTPHSRIFDTIVEDILNHRSDSIYDIVYIPYHATKYIYRFTCPGFTSISKDQDYLRCCIQQARFEHQRPRDPSDPSANKFKEPQPFQLTALPRN